LRMIQVISDADNVGRIHQMLLAFCTAWRTIGVRRAFLLSVDDRGRVLRGHLAAEQAVGDDETPESTTFESLARRVVECTQRIDTSDLTLRARTFTVPLDWPSSGAAKAANTGIPVLAERRLSEFANDPFFEFFGSAAYVAIPLRLRGAVNTVLVADNADSERRIGVEDISLVYSMSQQASTAVERLLESADNARKFRVLRKLQDALAAAEDTKRFGDSLSILLSMAARAVGGTGALIKDPLRKKVTHVKTVEDVDATDSATDIAITECFDDIMDRAAGTMQPVRGDAGHALLNDAAAASVRHFVALPLLAGGDCLGAMAVYVEERPGVREFSSRDRLFFELCAGMIAERLDSLYKAEQVRRTQRMFDEVQSNWLREREVTRSRQSVEEHHDVVVSQLREVSRTLAGSESVGIRLASAQELLGRIEAEAQTYEEERVAERQSLSLVDFFALVRSVAEEWAGPVRAEGVEVKLRIPERGPVLLMNREHIASALISVLDILARHVSKGDKALIECSTTADKAVVLFADTAGTADGSLLSRLFMPLASAGDDEAKSSASLAGDIIQRHGGEMTVRSSSSWKTILAISFPAAANSERRTRTDRRAKRNDRRA
ncbi:MAG TPA: hypothetical protein VFU38_03785, partial [Candidatus Krumholzibacteria bacterium]|nr:hypothetical protein [Candidatus Krumholzibacteria bacterium]